MLDHIVGELVERQAARVVLRTGGVGYDLKVPAGTLAEHAPGQPALLYTIWYVVDDVPALLGFATRAQRDVARKLMSVSGVGPAIALAILSAFTPGELVDTLVRGDHGALRRIKGIGTKTAERLCLELRDQIATVPVAGERAPAKSADPRVSDAVTALVTLGFAERDARERVQKSATAQPDASTEELVRLVLRGA